MWTPFRHRTTTLALALQGGGAHGAFTWGVLDALLERVDVPLVALSGTSAGAINALLLAHGLLAGGRDGARAALATFWTSLGRSLPFDVWGLVDSEGERLTAPGYWMLYWSQFVSPYQVNPLRIDPLRNALTAQIDFERLRAQRTLSLFIATTHANTGRLRVFGTDELSVDVALASACLPMLSQAVMIDGEPYWDGGYSANPPIWPLVRHTDARDIVVVVLSPWNHGELPRTVRTIRNRAAEIAFNAGFLNEMRWLAENQAMARRALWPGSAERRLRGLRVHLIDGEGTLAQQPEHSKVLAHLPWLERLCQAGRERALAWLDSSRTGAGFGPGADLLALFAADAVASTAPAQVSAN